MSYHIVSIDAPQADLTCRDGQLVCTTDTGVKKLPLEDIAAIIVTSFSARIHSHLFLEAAKQGVSLIFCERFQPVSLLLPACRASDTLLTRRHHTLPEKSRRRLWEKTIDAKCLNQLAIAERIAPGASPRRNLNQGKARRPCLRAKYCSIEQSCSPNAKRRSSISSAPTSRSTPSRRPRAPSRNTSASARKTPP